MHLVDGTQLIEHRMQVPLNWADPDGESLSIFAREFISKDLAQKYSGDPAAAPALLFLQGGPGGKAPRPQRLSGWMSEAAAQYRLIMLDQRGTGESSRADRHSVARRGSQANRVQYLRWFRADSIIRDAEALRQALGISSWTIMGQSYGGFCALSYLSFAPERLDAALLTGGLAPLNGHADEVYTRTYPRMRARNKEFFDRYPQDQQRWNGVVARIHETQPQLPDGSRLTVERLQLLGLALGGNTSCDGLHYLLAEAFDEYSPTGLSDTFLTQVQQRISFASNPLYAVLHESIYAQPAELTGGRGATNFSALRVRDQFPDFSPEAESPLLLGEMILPVHAALDPVLAPSADDPGLYGTLCALAEVDDWDPLYDLGQLRANEVPVAACVYTDDVFVDRELSLATAAALGSVSIYETADFHHDGIHDDGALIFSQLLSRLPPR